MKTELRIEARVTPEQKNKIAQMAEKCGLPQSEYIRKRALGYAPRALLPDAFYEFYAKLCELCNSVDGGDAEEKLLKVIDEIRSELLFPCKENTAQVKSGLERDKEWLQQDSGQSKET